MAFRREILANIGGFDPAYRFYLDETDVNFRLAQMGKRTAIAPLAQVHHGYKASATRTADRVPKDLFEIGASIMVYLRKHAPVSGHQIAIIEARDEQRRRVMAHLVRGTLEPRDVKRLLSRFDQGVEDGKARGLATNVSIPHARTGFQKFTVRFSGPHQVFSGNRFKRKHLMKLAKDAVQSGTRASVFVFSWTARPHKVRFTNAGVWLQTGGIFGRSVRTGQRFRLRSQRSTLASELKRLAALRKFRAIRD